MTTILGLLAIAASIVYSGRAITRHLNRIAVILSHGIAALQKGKK